MKLGTIFARGAVAAAAILVASSAFAGANLIQNGTFANPDENGSWSNEGASWQGWTTTAENGIEIGASSVYGLSSISVGGQNLELNGNTWGTDSYTVTGLTVGATYVLSYDYGARNSGGPSSATTTFGAALLTTDGGVGASGWTLDTFDIVATSGTETLTFAAIDTGAQSYGNEYTNVSLTAAAPEASTWAMMGLGFAGLAFAGYRGRRAAVSIA